MAQPLELVGWQFRYVFEDQGNRRSAWSTVLEGERHMPNGYRPSAGSLMGRDTVHYEVRDVYAGPVGGGAPGMPAAVSASESEPNALCGVHGPFPCEGAGCICAPGVLGTLNDQQEKP